MDENIRSRSQMRKKQRRLDSLINGLIVIVSIAIIIVAATIIMKLGKDDIAANDMEEKSEENIQLEDEEQLDEQEEEQAETENGSSMEGNDDKAEVHTGRNEGSQQTRNEQIVSNSDDENIIRTFVNPDWEPIGTVQEGDHVMTFSGVDWDEMVQALLYATNLTEDNVTVHWLGNNGHNKAVGTIYTKNKEQIYRVYIEWVDGKGWKPTLVEELKEIIEDNEEEADSEEKTENE